MARPVAARGLALLAVVVLAWGLTWPVNKVILASLTPIWAVAIRSAIGALALFALSLALGRLRVPPRSDVPVVLSLALLHMVGFGVLASVGLALVPTGRSVLLAYTTPLWVMPGAALFLGERLTARRAIGVLVGLAGLAVLFNPLALDWRSRDALIGNGAALASALSWAASILHLRGAPLAVDAVRSPAVAERAGGGRRERHRARRRRRSHGRVARRRWSRCCSTRAFPARRSRTGRWRWRARPCPR